MNHNRQCIVIARAEALFASFVPTGAPLTPAEAHEAVAQAVRSRGGIRRCAAEMAAVFGDSPDAAVARMRWALGIITEQAPPR
ncbi:hypothetical protein ACQP2Y_11590 [Actinoplanes sp. CA-051413]|uniref:hypothetical protein n=1 Tax=Actinoplanes sp. CA-051413 TaxID=3239899 RepID=UPI003D963971